MRVEGNANLLAAIGDLGVRRYLLQSSGFWYAPGAGLADESTPFIVDASPGVAASARTYAELEARASRTQDLEFVALRYGFFYGPKTPDGEDSYVLCEINVSSVFAIPDQAPAAIARLALARLCEAAR